MTGKCLLLVDDEPVLVELLRKFLERNSLAVAACADPVEALQLVQAEPQRYWLVVSDMTLPGMSGEELIERIQVLNPEIRAILASGYPHVPRSKSVAFLQKPFLPKMLMDMIQRLAGASANA
jgi:DNA-binding NtrC family response regulator